MFSVFSSNTDENLLQKFLLIELADITYAFKIEYIKEIIPVIETFSLNSSKSNAIGLINLRGETLPVFDIRVFTSKIFTNIQEQQKFLILTADGVKFALVIDNVGEIVQIQENAISSMNYNTLINFLSTAIVENKTVMIINVKEFIKQADLEDFSQGEIVCSNNLNVLTSEKIKNRAQLINYKNGNYSLQEAFLDEKFIIFKLGREIYSFNINYVKEIKKIPAIQISQIPCVPDFVRGIVNFRGDYISVLDIKYFLGIEKSREENEKIEILILKINNQKLAILVDGVIDITNLPISDINAENTNSDSYIIGELYYQNDMMINLLNVEKLFSSENINIENQE